MALNVRERLGKADAKLEISKRAREKAAARGHSVSGWHSDFGRRLEYYHKIHALLKKHGKGLRGKKLLHIASATGVYTRYLQNIGVKAVGMDLNPEAGAIAKEIENKRTVLANARVESKNLPKRFFPFADNSFDFFLSDRFLFSTYVPLEGESFLPANPQLKSIEALEEAVRVLKPGGIGIIHHGTRGKVPLGQKQFLQDKRIKILERQGNIAVFQKKRAPRRKRKASNRKTRE